MDISPTAAKEGLGLGLGLGLVLVVEEYSKVSLFFFLIE